MDFRSSLRRILKRQKSRKVLVNEVEEKDAGQPELSLEAAVATAPRHLYEGPPSPTPPDTSRTPSVNEADHATLDSQHDTIAITPSDVSKDRLDAGSSVLIPTPDEHPHSDPAAAPITHPSTSDLDTTTPKDLTSELIDLAPARPAVILQQPTPPPRNEQSRVPSDADAKDDGHLSVSSSESLAPPAEPSETKPRLSPPDSASVSTYDLSPLQQASPPAESPLPPGIDGAQLSPPDLPATDSTSDFSGIQVQPPTPAFMAQRKIWVKRPGQSATLISIQEDDLVDDVRDKILRKYANSLGRSFDSPDVVLRIATRQDGPRSAPSDRMLGPEEEMSKTLNQYYPGGQQVTDALIIDIPPKRTPRPSPRQHQTHGSHGNVSYQALEDYRPQESGTDYFPPMPAVVQPMHPQNGGHPDPRALPTHILHLPDHSSRSMSVLGTGHVPPLPSPGAATRRHRPKYPRQHTSSPTIIAHNTNANAVAVNSPGPGSHQHMPFRGRPRNGSNTSERPNAIPVPPPLPTPPAPEAPPTAKNSETPPTPLPRDHHRTRPRKTRKLTPTGGTNTLKASKNSAASLLDGTVPPINVLIVEDNIINLKLLEAFMKRLKVRWSTAMNGQIAVNKWRQGGFHLVLMDIQMPIMNGLDATKEMRRLERVNGIGVFSSSAPPTPMANTKSDTEDGETNGDGAVAAVSSPEKADPSKDKLKTDEGLFKSPVIIVALTASSLQSDRHEALAAGCNDFLTKPVNFVWLERKVKEWGCMQALIDYDGWRQWKDFSSTGTDAAAGKTNGKAINGGGKNGAGVNGAKSPTLDGLSKADLAAKAREKKAKREKRASADVGGVVASAKRPSMGESSDVAEETA